MNDDDGDKTREKQSMAGNNSETRGARTFPTRSRFNVPRIAKGAQHVQTPKEFWKDGPYHFWKQLRWLVKKVVSKGLQHLARVTFSNVNQVEEQGRPWVAWVPMYPESCCAFQTGMEIWLLIPLPIRPNFTWSVPKFAAMLNTALGQALPQHQSQTQLVVRSW